MPLAEMMSLVFLSSRRFEGFKKSRKNFGGPHFQYRDRERKNAYCTRISSCLNTLLMYVLGKFTKLVPHVDHEGVLKPGSEVHR